MRPASNGEPRPPARCATSGTKSKCAISTAADKAIAEASDTAHFGLLVLVCFGVLDRRRRPGASTPPRLLRRTASRRRGQGPAVSDRGPPRDRRRHRCAPPLTASPRPSGRPCSDRDGRGDVPIRSRRDRAPGSRCDDRDSERRAPPPHRTADATRSRVPPRTPILGRCKDPMSAPGRRSRANAGLHGLSSVPSHRQAG